MAVCEKTAGLRSGNFSDLNSVFYKVIVSLKIFQFPDMRNENRVLDTFWGHSKRPNIFAVSKRDKGVIGENGTRVRIIFQDVQILSNDIADLKLKYEKLKLGDSVVVYDISHRVSEGLRSGNLGGLRKGSMQWGTLDHLDQELSHFQAFGLEVFIFTVKVTKFGWCG